MSRSSEDKQMEIYEFIKTQIVQKGYPPSVREICKGVGLSSTSSVHSHLSKLEKKGLIRRDSTKPRTIEILKEPMIIRSEEHTSELQSRQYLVCRLLLEKKNDQ